MSDPVVEAVQRAVQVTRERRGETFQVDGAEIYELLCDVAEDAAREALKPVREWFELAEANAIAEDLYDQTDLLESLAPLIYTTEELGA